MGSRVALIGIIVESNGDVNRLNNVLHEYGKYIIGRLVIPYREKSVSIISVAIDAPQDVINSLSGKLGKIDGVSVKTTYSNVVSE